jgi:hypothetical protein
MADSLNFFWRSWTPYPKTPLPLSLVTLPGTLPHLRELTLSHLCFESYDELLACPSSSSASLRRLVVSRCRFPHPFGSEIDSDWTMDKAWRHISPRKLALETLELRDPKSGSDVFMFLGRPTLEIVLGLCPDSHFQILIDFVNDHANSLTSLHLLCPDLGEPGSTLDSTS